MHTPFALSVLAALGHLSHREMEEEHPLELERILEAEEKERAKAEMAEAEGGAKDPEKPKA